MSYKNILWIDDEADKLNGLFRWMSKDKYRLVKCKDKASAEVEIEKRLDNYDLIILDLILPKGVDYSAAEVEKAEQDRLKLEGLHILNRIQDASNIPVMIMTVVSGGGYFNKISQYRSNSSSNIKEVLIKGNLTPNEIKTAVQNILGD